MENKHKKSRRSLHGKDVYELACKYDVGWSKKRQKNDGSKNDECDKKSKKKHKDKRKRQHNSSSVKMETEVEDRSTCNGDSTSLKSSETHDHESTLLKKRKTLDFKSRIKQKKKLQEVEKYSVQDSIEQELHPLHAQWKFTKKQLGELRNKGIKMKFGNWSKKESTMLENNMKEYLKANNITDPMPLILADNGKRGKNIKMQCMSTNFYRSLGKGIDRPLFHVYRRILRIYDPENHVGRWSESDSQTLLRFHGLYGDQWTKIGSFLGRSGMSVHHKYLELHQPHAAGYWSEEESERLDAAVRASTGTEFGNQIYDKIDWIEVASFVMTRTSDQCRVKWIRSMCWKTASGEKSVKWSSQDDVKLIERLYAANECDENDINWVLMTKDLPNSPSVTWLRLHWNTLKKAVPNYTECDFEEILDYLYNTHRPFLKKKATDNDEHS